MGEAHQPFVHFPIERTLGHIGRQRLSLAADQFGSDPRTLVGSECVPALEQILRDLHGRQIERAFTWSGKSLECIAGQLLFVGEQRTGSHVADANLARAQQHANQANDVK